MTPPRHGQGFGSGRHRVAADASASRRHDGCRWPGAPSRGTAHRRPRPPPVLLRRQVGRVAEPARPPLRGDDRRLAVIVGRRGSRLRRACPHDRRPLQRHRLPLPRRALVAVGRGDDAVGHGSPGERAAGRERWPGVLDGAPTDRAEGRGVPASPQRGGCSADARRNKAAPIDSRLIG